MCPRACVAGYSRDVTDPDGTMLARPERTDRPESSDGRARTGDRGPERSPERATDRGDATGRASVGSGGDPLIGAELAGTYRITRVMGEGGMGKLYEAEHVRIDRRYAIKVIHAQLANRDDLRVRFDREARAMSKVRSDHVVDVIDVVRMPDGRPCIVTEKLEGEDLEARLRRKRRMPSEEAVPLVRQALRGLMAAHALGVVHRDLKPANLFLSKDAAGIESLKVLDFGVAKVADDAELTGTGAIVGTPAFMAPEQARSSNQADVRSDLYAMGAVLYRMLTGSVPYGGADASTTLVRLLEESPERPRTLEKSIPEGLEAVIEKAMARDPAQRFQTAKELEQALAFFDPTATSSGVALRDSFSREARRTRPLTISALLALTITSATAVGVGLALLVDGLGDTSRVGIPELVLVGLVAAVTGIGVLAWGGRLVLARWKNTAMLVPLRDALVGGTLTGLLSYGVIELGGRVYTLTLHMPSATPPLWASLRVASACLLGLATLAWKMRAIR